jgi:hypothetical protein
MTTPGKKPASATPRKNRIASKPPKLETAAVQMVIIPHEITLTVSVCLTCSLTLKLTDAAYPDGRREVLHGEVTRRFEKDIWHEKDRNGNVVTIAGKTEFLDDVARWDVIVECARVTQVNL